MEFNRALWYGVLAFLTPPMAVGAALAAKVAGSRFWPTAFEAVKVASAAFIIPFLMVYCPGIILEPSSFGWATLEILGALTLITSIQGAICGAYFRGRILRLKDRLLLTVIALVTLVGLLHHMMIIVIAGIALMIIMSFPKILPKEKIRAGR